MAPRTYREFLTAKTLAAPRAGVSVVAGDLHGSLFAWQAEIVVWACNIGQSCRGRNGR